MNKSITNFGKLSAVLLVALVSVSSCKKDKMPAIESGPVSTQGVYVLCEGPFGQVNNSSITYYDVAKNISDKNYFKTQNGIDLGTAANDLKAYGSKMYCVITGTVQANKDSYVEVINIATGKSIKRIPFSDDSKGFMPRSIAFYQNKAYVSGYDGYISKIDTASLTIEARVAVGGALEGLTIVNGKLYVANSSHPDYVNANNSSVSVVDLNSFTKLKDIQVSFNPSKIAATSTGDLFVVTSGNYLPAIAPAFEKLNGVTDTKTQTFDYNLSSITIAGNKGFVITGDYPASLKTFNTTSAAIGDNFITDDTAPSTFYGVIVNTFDDNVFVTDATDYSGDGKVFCFGPDGKQKFEFTTGTIPKTAVFNYSYK